MAMSAKDNALLNDITMMMTDPSQAQNDSKIEQIMQKIRNLDAKKTGDQLRLAACHVSTLSEKSRNFIFFVDMVNVIIYKI